LKIIFHVDFELAMIQAIKVIFPLAIIIACAFHLLQSINRWINEDSQFPPYIWSHNFIQLFVPDGYKIDATTKTPSFGKVIKVLQQVEDLECSGVLKQIIFNPKALLDQLKEPEPEVETNNRIVPNASILLATSQQNKFINIV